MKLPPKIECRLVPNWRLVIRRSWSIWLIVLAGLLSGAEVAINLLPVDLPVPQGLMAAIAASISGFAYVARLLAQKSLHENEETKE